ncbi:hypothetical protein [Planococcus sp. ISL-109]|uniref:hypothetical protein n=1 Tax=Planococcus sp. ISL-109 TaxID=2819166 RepID=UPI001BEA6634|nr:hypothetical protein [Planococcus sp. ISL-109]MBT2583946.1 hypothetical protein [Planococcus sp. ISL-109]
MGSSRDPFIWIPVVTQQQEEDVQFKDKRITGKEFRAAGQGEFRKHAPISRDNLEEMVRGFEGYEVETIELNVVGGIETGGALQFIIAGKAEAGMTVTLKKKGRMKETEKEIK